MKVLRSKVATFCILFTSFYNAISSISCTNDIFYGPELNMNPLSQSQLQVYEKHSRKREAPLLLRVATEKNRDKVFYCFSREERKYFLTNFLNIELPSFVRRSQDYTLQESLAVQTIFELTEVL